MGGFSKHRVRENLFYARSLILLDEVIIVQLASEREVVGMLEIRWKHNVTKLILIFYEKTRIIWFLAPADYVIGSFITHKIVKVDDKRLC